jgi:pimeloyl-ACP methyl ester carboxylesterase
MESMRFRVALLALLCLPACRAQEPRAMAIARDPAEGVVLPAPPAAPEIPTPEFARPNEVPDTGPIEAASADPARVERIDIEHDVPAAIVRGQPGQRGQAGPSGHAPRIVFLAGVCSNAYAYLLAFPEAARAHGGIVAIDGDKPCGAEASGFRSFSWDPALQDRRIQAALAAAGAGEAPEGAEQLTLIGYSAGAGIGELMVQRWPKRYARVVLIGSPSDPQPARLARARGVVTVSCSHDVPGRMRDAARRIFAAGVPATYLEMPGCTHGNMADGERVFGTALDWLNDHAT